MASLMRVWKSTENFVVASLTAYFPRNKEALAYVCVGRICMLEVY
ncbi:MAG: hypothetical protein QXU99_03615 [Candidatus Bathyarchaeia archaeon]